jgi:H+/Cl- antiporter ClcA
VSGVAAGFNAPISGVFFAMESVLNREPRNLETEARNSSGLSVGMVLLASVVAAIVSRAGLGDSPAFRVPPYQLQSIWELPLVMLLGSTCGLVSVGFSYCSEVRLTHRDPPIYCPVAMHCLFLKMPQICVSKTGRGHTSEGELSRG